MIRGARIGVDDDAALVYAAGAMTRALTVIDHPLVQHKLTLMRMKERSTSSFRQLLVEISMLLAYEVTRDLPLIRERIETPVAPMDAPLLDGKKVVLVSILRAGNGILDGMLKILPSARVGMRSEVSYVPTTDSTTVSSPLRARRDERDAAPSGRFARSSSSSRM